MKNEFVPYDIALVMKELGFDEPTICSYYKDDQGLYMGNPTHLDDVNAPLYQQAFRWFREKYKLHSTITSISQESWQWHIQKPGQKLGELYDEDFYTYEEAKLECLKKLIEIVN